MLYNGKGESNLKKRKLPSFDNKIKLTHLIIACLAVTVVTAVLTYVAAIGGFGSKQYLEDARRYVEIEKIIDQNYIGDADYNELYNAAAAAMVKSIGDKWSYFMSAEEYEAYKLSSSNEYSGIGLSVKLNDGGEFEVFSVEESSPAASAGIAVGDLITAIDGEAVSDKTLEDVSLLIRSKVNKDFPITIERGGDTKTVTVACEIIYKNPVSSRLLDGNIGYIKISNFEAGASENTKKAIEQLIQTGATSFIFAIQNETQKRELAEYKATKKAQEQTIQELQKMAEKNQKQLAYLTQLEDKVRQEMAKNGTQLPPKSDIASFAGKGGPSLGDSSPMGYMLEQEKNIQNEAKAKKADLENILSAIESSNLPAVAPFSASTRI